MKLNKYTNKSQVLLQYLLTVSDSDINIYKPCYDSSKCHHTITTHKLKDFWPVYFILSQDHKITGSLLNLRWNHPVQIPWTIEYTWSWLFIIMSGHLLKISKEKECTNFLGQSQMSYSFPTGEVLQSHNHYVCNVSVCNGEYRTEHNILGVLHQGWEERMTSLASWSRLCLMK